LATEALIEFIDAIQLNLSVYLYVQQRRVYKDGQIVLDLASHWQPMMLLQNWWNVAMSPSYWDMLLHSG